MKYSEYASIIPAVKEERILRVLDEIQDRLDKLEKPIALHESNQETYTYCTVAERQFLDELKEKGFLDKLDGNFILHEGKNTTTVISQDNFKTNFKDIFK